MAGLCLDTNVILRHLLGDHPDQSPSATAFIKRVQDGEIEVHTADTVVFEAACTLDRYYKRLRGDIRDVLLPLLELPGIVLPGKRRYRKVFDIYVERRVSFADAYHVVLAEHQKVDQIVSIDRGLDWVPGAYRIEP